MKRMMNDNPALRFSVLPFFFQVSVYLLSRCRHHSKSKCQGVNVSVMSLCQLVCNVNVQCVG